MPATAEAKPKPVCSYCNHCTHERAECPHEALVTIRQQYQKAMRRAESENYAFFRQMEWTKDRYT